MRGRYRVDDDRGRGDTALVALVQQVAIWETAAGLALVALFAALGLGFAWTALVDRARA